MRSIYQLLLSMLLASLGFVGLEAQQAGVAGRVLDEEGHPMIQANVQLVQSTGQKAVVAGATDEKGMFSLKTSQDGDYILRVSYVGYNTHDEKISLKSGQTITLKDISMNEDARLLQSVTVQAKAAEVVVRNDTLEFNAGSYTVAQGASIEELIKKLPGAEISSDGKITINGKDISKILVDGKEFFSKDPKVAMKNLPADMVNKVQVLNKLSELSRMSGFDDGEEQTVINLTVKPEKKKGLFGSVQAGYGTDQRYMAGGNVNRFDGNKQWTLIGSANNTNNMGFSEMGSEMGSMTFFSPQGFGRRGFGNSGGITSSSMLGGNFSVEFSSALNTGGDARYGYNDKAIETTKRVENILAEGNTYMDESISERSFSHNGQARFRLQWKPSERTEVVFEPDLSISKMDGFFNDAYETKNTTGSIINKGSIHQTTQGNNFRLNGELDISHKLNDEGRTLSASISGGLTDEDGEGIYQAVLQSVETNQKQFNDNSNLQYRLRLSYVEPLGKNYFAQAILNRRFSRRNSDREVYRLGDDGLYSTLDDQYGLSYNNEFTQYRIGLNLKKIAKTWDYTVGFNVDPNRTVSYRNVGGVEQDKLAFNRVNLSPMLRINYKPNKTTNLRVDYRGRTTQPSINQIAPVQDITNPLFVTEGNPGLKPSYSNNVMAMFSDFDAKSQRAFSIVFFGNYTFDDIVPNTHYDQSTGIRTTRYENASGTWQANLHGTLSVPLKNRAFSFRMSLFNRLAEGQSFINDNKNKALSFRTRERLTLTYRNDWIDTGIGGNIGFYMANNSLSGQKDSRTYDFGGNYQVALTLPYGFRIDSQFEYNTNSGYSGGFSLNEWLWDASLSYSFLRDKAGTLRVKGYDILGQRSNISRSATAINIEETMSNTIGRYVMVDFIYRFNAFSGGGSRSDHRRGNMNRPGAPFGRGGRPS
ncbi:collagen-binding protein [Porphyromonas gulae]|uniref:Collagen-binding protein n=2 Tax=Porphyromonas gulae TaxID=111105 RepID=A0A0A2E2I5_9PORP|nr:TonB-dependent receptor [Porphyromonas gulae]KGN71675.1 collagen-binding protein [Porphyromonas gulae]KGN86441.1 collagen-binding protein [Porphyromonas gulae]KGO03666.1 collagen-binding protein [Porphyromonas gulae]